MHIAQTVILENSTISGNIAIQNGGGLYNASSSAANTPSLVAVTVYDNQAGHGSGLYTSQYPTEIRMSIAAGN
ncbi:MAG: hypothetical protein P8J32_01350, partial [bacterium]|nr:hypothetical protein [bacterium]